MKLRYKIEGIFKLSDGSTGIVYSVDWAEAERHKHVSDTVILRTSDKVIQNLKVLAELVVGRTRFDRMSVRTYDDVLVSQANIEKESHFLEFDAELVTREDIERIKSWLRRKKTVLKS